MGWIQAFFVSYCKLQETTYITMQDAGIHHDDMVLVVMTGLQELLQKYQAPIDTPMTVHEPQKHEENYV